MLISIHASAQPDLQHCALIEDDTTRLGCYDKLVLPTDEIIDQESAAPVAEMAEELVNIAATISTASHSRSNGWTITFENGQSWRQIGTASFVVNTADTCTISPGPMNSYLLQCENRARRIQVEGTE
jgi:hypothetical protein